MGVYTYIEFQSKLVTNLGERDDIGNQKANWINIAYLNFSTRNKFWKFTVPKLFTFPELDTISEKTTADGQAYILKESNYLFAYTLWDKTNDVPITFRPYRWYIKQTGRNDADAEDKPQFWTTYGNKIYLYPTPDSAYNITVYYRKKPALLTGTNTTAIGEEWDESILLLATAQSARRLMDWERAKQFRSEFIDTTKDLMLSQPREWQDMKNYVRPAPSYILPGRDY